MPNVYLNDDNELELIEYEMIPHDDIVLDEDIPIDLMGKEGVEYRTIILMKK